MSRKPDAEIDLNAGAMFVNSAIQDLIVPNDEDDSAEKLDDFELPDEQEIRSFRGEGEIIPARSSTKDPMKDLSEEEEEEEEEDIQDQKPKKPITSDDEGEEEEEDDELEGSGDFADYSESALHLLALKRELPEFVDIDETKLKKDLSPQELHTYLKQGLIKVAEEEREVVRKQYGDAAQYLDFVLKGGSNDVVREAMQLRAVASMEITDESSDEDLIYVIQSGLSRKGIEKDDAEGLIDTWKNRGILFEKAEEYQEFHKELEQKIIDDDLKKRKQAQEKEDRDQKAKRKEVEAVVKKGNANGMPITNPDNLLKAIYTPTETREYIDKDGKKKFTKVPLYFVKYEEFNNSVEQQVAFAQLLLDGFDFTKIKTTAKKAANEEIFNELYNRRSRKPDKGSGWRNY